MALLDLAPELLTLIFHHLGAVELRTSVTYLLISKAWYRAALPVYLSGLQFSTLYLSSRDLERLPPADAPLSSLIHSTTTRLSVRLVGHPSRQIAKRPWHVEEESHDEESDTEDQDDDWRTTGPILERLDGGRKTYNWLWEEHKLLAWRKRINTKLAELATWLLALKDLEELSFEASSEDGGTLGPRWDYFIKEPIMSLLASLPNGLKHLTLDTCGSTIATSMHDRSPAHVCPLIAKRLHEFQHVRIRMRHICPQVLGTSDGSSTRSRLQSLVIRLSIPFFPPATYETHNGKTEFDAQACAARYAPLWKSMVAAGRKFAKATSSLKMMRVSYRDFGHSGINLIVADCVRRHYMFEGSEIFSYEDDGREWDSWEGNDERLQISGSF